MRLLIKFKSAKHIAMIGDRNRRHSLASYLFDQLFNACRPIQHRILGVNMEVNEIVILRHGK